MHEYIIDSMLAELEPALKSNKKARSILESFWKDKIALVWDTNDIHTAANEREVALTNDEAIHVLNELHRQHNKQYGLRWEDLTSYIQKNGLGRKLTKRELKRFIDGNMLTIHRSK